MAESVWDYPRLPSVEPTGDAFASSSAERRSSTRAVPIASRDGHPPVYYVPPEDVAPAFRRF
jgi:uncharacterized protein (DUF427 family)